MAAPRWPTKLPRAVTVTARVEVVPPSNTRQALEDAIKRLEGIAAKAPAETKRALEGVIPAFKAIAVTFPDGKTGRTGA